MRSRARISTLLLVLAGVPLALIAVRLLAESSQWFYDYKAKPPSTGMISVEIDAPSSARATEFSLMADGRLRIVERSSGPGRKVLRTMDWQVGTAEADRLVDEAVQCNLAVFDPAKRTAELRKKNQPMPVVLDGPSVRFRLELSSLARDAEPAVSPFKHEFSVSSPRELAASFPQDAEYKCLDSLVNYLTEIYYQARRNSK